jgi:hypothetical protein
MRHFLFEDQEYRINLRFRRKRNEQDSAQALARLLRQKSPRRASGGRGMRVDTRQNCVAKMQYSASIEAHRLQLEQYLTREGTERDGSRAMLYGTDITEYRQHMAEKNFRIFLSPQSDKANLTELTETFIKKLELQTGYKLYWQAANHYNTAHPHAHLLINGVDKFGKEIKFPKDIVKTFMRETARTICTAQLGTRTREELELEKERELTAPRYTRLDKRIEELCFGGRRVDLEGVTVHRERILTRLEYLRGLKLCAYREGGYELDLRWEESLRANGRYNAFLKARDSLAYTHPARFKVYTGAEGQVTGKVTKIYRTDGDASDSHALVLESPDGKAHFIPFFKKPELRDGERKAELKEGDLVTVKTYESQQGRLTPRLYRAPLRKLKQEIKTQHASGALAEEILGAKEKIFSRRAKYE